MQINGLVIKKKTIAIVSALAAGSIITQTSWIRDHLSPLVEGHPHLALLVPFLTGIVALIHNPIASKIAGDLLSVPITADVQQVTTVTTAATDSSTKEQQ